jgi:hypothetical protein
MKKYILFIFSLAILFPLIIAEEISINNGGSTGMVITPDKYNEGFFSGDVQVPVTCGNGVCDSDETCLNCQFDCGACAPVCGDGVCNGAETCSTCSVDCGGCGGGGGGGGGVPGANIRIDPTEIDRHMLINSNIEEDVGVLNLDSSTPITFTVSSSGFNPDLIVNFWDVENREWVKSFSLTLPAGGLQDLRVRFSAPNYTDNFTGLLHIDGKGVRVNLTVQEKLLLFDSNVIVLNENYIVPQGDMLRTSVTLIPLGDKERMDVTLNYVIKDYDGKIYLTRSETVLVENQVNFKRNFDTGFLPLGQYIVGLELIYPNGVAPSSAHFEVTFGRQNTFFGKLVFFIINIILLVLIILILLIILRMIKQIKANRKIEEQDKHRDKEIEEKENKIDNQSSKKNKNKENEKESKDNKEKNEDDSRFKLKLDEDSEEKENKKEQKSKK